VQEETANWSIYVPSEAYQVAPVSESTRAVRRVLRESEKPLRTRDIVDRIVGHAAPDRERNVIRKRIHYMYATGQLFGVHSGDEATKWMLAASDPEWSAEFLIVRVGRAGD
jgi:hypothetical protein